MRRAAPEQVFEAHMTEGWKERQSTFHPSVAPFPHVVVPHANLSAIGYTMLYPKLPALNVFQTRRAIERQAAIIDKHPACGIIDMFHSSNGHSQK